MFMSENIMFKKIFSFIFLSMLSLSVMANDLTFEQKERIHAYESNAKDYPQFAAGLWAGESVGTSHIFSHQDNTNSYIVTVTKIENIVKPVDKYKNVTSTKYLENLNKHYKESVPLTTAAVGGFVGGLAADQASDHNEVHIRNASGGAYMAAYLVGAAIGEHEYNRIISKDTGVAMLPAKQVFFSVNDETGRFYQFDANLPTNLKVGDKVRLFQNDHVWFYQLIN